MSDKHSTSGGPTLREMIDARDFVNSIFGGPMPTVASIDSNGHVTEVPATFENHPPTSTLPKTSSAQSDEAGNKSGATQSTEEDKKE